MGHSEDVLRKLKLMSIGFSVTPKCRTLNVLLWDWERSVDVNFLWSDQGSPPVKSQLSKISQFFRVVSRSPEVNSCSRVGFDTIELLLDLRVLGSVLIFPWTSKVWMWRCCYGNPVAEWLDVSICLPSWSLLHQVMLTP